MKYCSRCGEPFAWELESGNYICTFCGATIFERT